MESHWSRSTTGLATLGVLALLASCGNASEKPKAVTRLEVTPSAVLLTAAGESRKLTVRAYDASGAELPSPPLVFASSRPGEVEVTADGLVRAATAVGSALISVTTGSVTSAPLLVTVADLVPGALTVTDQQVVSGPELVDTSATPGADVQYRVILTGVGLPAPGTPLVGLGDKPIGGRVVGATAAGDQTELVVEVGDLPSLFRNLKIDVSYSPTETAGFMQLAPAIAGGAMAQSRRAASVTNPNGCKWDGTGAPFTGELSLKVDPSVMVDVAVTLRDSTVESLLIAAAGTMEVTGRATVEVGAVLSSSISCKLLLGRIPVPITGVLSYFLAPIVPIEGRLSFNLTYKNSLFIMSAEVKQRAEMAMGIAYTPDNGLLPIESLTSHDPTFKVVVNKPDNEVERLRFKAFVGLGTGVEVGNLVVALDIVELTAGPEFEAKFGGPYDAAQDPLYRTGYELKARIALAPGQKIKEALKHVFGSDKVVNFSAKIEKSLGKTAQGASLVADKDYYRVGQTIHFDVKLDPASVDFLAPGLYDVGEVRVYRLDQGQGTANLVATAPAAAGQTDFRLSWVADAAGRVVDSTGTPNFYVFLVDRLLAPIIGPQPFEVGPVAATRSPGQGCDATKRFCGVSLGRAYFVPGNVDMYVDENGVVYAAAWGQDGNWLMPYTTGPRSGACFSSLDPPRTGMPSRSGKFIVKAEGPDPQEYVLDHAFDPCNPTQLRLPLARDVGKVYGWTAVSDGGWAVGYVANGAGPADHSPVRVDTRIRDPDPLQNVVTGPVEVLPIAGQATDVNDAGTIVGVTSVGFGIFTWSDLGVTSIETPPGTSGCDHVTINSEGSLLATCWDPVTGLWGYVRMAGSGAWTKVESLNGGPKPILGYGGRVNAAGQVVTGGGSDPANMGLEVVLWEGGRTVSLLDVTGFDVGQPVYLHPHAAINDAGQIGIVSVQDATVVEPRVYLVEPNPAYVP
jgi:hypothetical protein